MTAPRTDAVAAFTRIYDQTVARVYGVVLGVVGDPEDAARITEQVYLAWWGREDALDPPPPSALALLVTTAHRAAVDHLRGLARGSAAPTECSRRCCARHVGAGVGEPPAPASAVQEAVASLPEQQGRAIEMAFFGGHSCDDIAGLLGAPRGSVARWMRDGVGHVRSATVSAMTGPGDTMGP